MATTLNAVTVMGKSYSTMQNVVQNEEKITLKQMFDITAPTIHNDEEIYCLDKIEYQRNTWTQLSLINDPVVHWSSKRQGLRVLRFCAMSRQSSSTS